MRALCFSEEAGLLRVGPNCRQFTRHAQAWAVINGLFDPAQSRTALKNALACPPCSFAASYEWFRALEQAGMEDEMRQSLDAWIGLIDRGNTITPSGPVHYWYQKCADGQWSYEVQLPENTEGLFITPSGRRIPFTGQLLITV